jgi:hypothetical protein
MLGKELLQIIHFFTFSIRMNKLAAKAIPVLPLTSITS